MNRREMEREIGRLSIMTSQISTDLSRTEARVSVNRCVVDTVRPVVENIQGRLAKLERDQSKESSPVSLAACSQAAEHGWELGRRSAAREIREELHLGASWSEFRDWIGREFLGE